MLSLSPRLIAAAALSCGLLFGTAVARAADWPLFGRDGTRNAVSPERSPPTNWDIGRPIDKDPGKRIEGSSRNIKWSAALGSDTHSTPVVSGGLVWIGTNTSRRDMKPGDQHRSVLKCFRVRDGKPVYEYISPNPAASVQNQSWTGLTSSPLVEGDRLWVTTSHSEVLCLDIGPLLRDEKPPREVWTLDPIKSFGINPHRLSMWPPHPCSIGPSWNGRIFVTTTNGVGQNRNEVPKPDAPSLVCLNKDTSEVYWKDNSPGPNILVTQFSSPTVVEIRGQAQVIVPQSDGWIRAFDPMTGEKIWEFDVNAKTAKYVANGRPDRNSLLGNAVVYEDRVYIASGLDAEQGDGPGRLVCIDPTRRGDISSELAVDADGTPLPRRRLQAVNPAAGEKAIPNPNSALVWEFVNCGKKFEDVMHGTIGSVVIARGLVIAADSAGLVHCFDAKTGQRHWSHDTLAGIWGSPLIVDDKVFITSTDGEVLIFGLAPDPDVALRRLNGEAQPRRTIPMEAPINGSPVFADGVLYVATQNQLFAIATDKDEPDLDLAAGYWPQWRGPNRDNASSEKGLLQEWPAGGPPLLWTATGVGEGIASVSVAEGKIFTFGYQAESEFVVALEENTGELSWATRIGPAVAESPLMRWLSQRSPTVDGPRLYLVTAGGDLVCLSAPGGRELWRKSYTADFGARRPAWGFCDRPLVDGDRLICTPGGAEANVVALEKTTGAVVWKTAVPAGNPAAYAATVISRAGGVRHYVVVLKQVLMGVAADNGRVLWQYDKLSTDQNSFTPIVLDDRLLCACGRQNARVVMLQLVPDGAALRAEEQYVERAALNHFQDNLVVVDRHLYGTTQRGPVCVELATGKVVWEAERENPRSKMGALIAADGRLYLRQSDGVLKLIEANPAARVEKGTFTIPDPQPSIGATSPVIAGRRLYLRDNNRLLCYDIRADALKVPAAPSRTVMLGVVAAAARAGSAAPADGPRDGRPARGVFVPTPHDVVKKMLALAEVKKSDVVYDLGSGDGRIVIAAAKEFGCKAVGYEIDAELVALSREKARADDVEKLVTIEKADVFTVDVTPADVVTLYLLPQQNEKLVPQLKKLKPGSRVVSHQFEILGMKPERSVIVESKESGEKHTLFLYVLPPP